MESKPINILHIEDDAVDAMVMERALKKCDIKMNLYKATNGLEALEMLRGENGRQKIDPLPRIILLDLNMPKMNGIEFLRALRADPQLRHIAVFVMTTSSDEQDRIEAHNLNVAGYMIKPLTLESYTNIVSVLNAYWKITDFGRP